MILGVPIIKHIMVLSKSSFNSKVEFQWLEHPRDHENMFETGVVQANECYR